MFVYLRHSPVSTWQFIQSVIVMQCELFLCRVWINCILAAQTVPVSSVNQLHRCVPVSSVNQLYHCSVNCFCVHCTSWMCNELYHCTVYLHTRQVNVRLKYLLTWNNAQFCYQKTLKRWSTLTWRSVMYLWISCIIAVWTDASWQLSRSSTDGTCQHCSKDQPRRLWRDGQL